MLKINIIAKYINFISQVLTDGTDHPLKTSGQKKNIMLKINIIAKYINFISQVLTDGTDHPLKTSGQKKKYNLSSSTPTPRNSKETTKKKLRIENRKAKPLRTMGYECCDVAAVFVLVAEVQLL